MKNKPTNQNWWEGKDTFKITATHWKTFLIGIKLGRILGGLKIKIVKK